MKAIIKCPTCEWQGIIQNLAEYLPAEGIVVIRRSKGFIPYQKTIVRGNDFELICERCQNVAFRKMPVLIQQTTQMIFGTI